MVGEPYQNENRSQQKKNCQVEEIELNLQIFLSSYLTYHMPSVRRSHRRKSQIARVERADWRGVCLWTIATILLYSSNCIYEYQWILYYIMMHPWIRRLRQRRRSVMCLTDLTGESESEAESAGRIVMISLSILFPHFYLFFLYISSMGIFSTPPPTEGIADLCNDSIQQNRGTNSGRNKKKERIKL